MNVYLTKGPKDQIPGDLMYHWVLRSDLAPIPRSVEFTVQLMDGLAEKLAVGARIWTGREVLEYQIVKSEGIEMSAVVQGKDQVKGLKITALLASCVGISYVRERAVIRYGATLGEIYRACGTQVSIGGDFTVNRFVCLRGQTPSYGIARAMQDEAAALIFRDGRLSFMRLNDMMKQKPADDIGQTDSTNHIDSEFIERHTIPSFYSLADDGSFVMGDFDVVRDVAFIPYSDERTLRNASKVLVTRRIIPSDMAQQILAGDILKVGPDNFAVITAAHSMIRKDGITESNTKFWVGNTSV